MDMPDRAAGRVIAGTERGAPGGIMIIQGKGELSGADIKSPRPVYPRRRVRGQFAV